MARRTFFSFHYQFDVWRAWNVRNCWLLQPKDKQDEGFFDGSVFEASQREGDDVLKAFLRDGLKNTSVTCVLAGEQTWARRWVRYEIVRSILKGNGLLTVDIDGLEDRNNKLGVKGEDPLGYVGLYRTETGIYFAEWSGSKWIKYEDYTRPVAESDLWFAAPTSKTVQPLSKHCLRYDFVAQNGRKNLVGWIETAASMAGR